MWLPQSPVLSQRYIFMDALISDASSTVRGEPLTPCLVASLSDEEYLWVPTLVL